MPIITLTTDWEKRDYYIGAVKGSIHKLCGNVSVIDISHQVKTFNIFQAAFILRNSYKNFPDGTIHIIGVKSDYAENQKPMIIEFENQYFIGADNGIFSLLFDDKPIKSYEIEHKEASSFPELDIFIPAACSIINGSAPETLGKINDQINRRVSLHATIEDSIIIGRIVYIDSYQNAITNITTDLFEKVGQGRSFKIFVQSNGNVVSKINKIYQETAPGELLAIFNSAGLLEIAICEGNAAELLGLDTNSTVRIRFK